MTTAEIGIVSTAVVGSLGIVVPAVSRWVDRGHERSMALSSRLYAQRLTLYNEVARVLEDYRLIAERTHPIIGPKPPPPGAGSEEEAHQLNARLSVGGSEDVLDAMRVASTALVNFQGAVYVFEGVQDQPTQFPDARRQMDDARGRVFEAVDAAQGTMRDELEKV